MCNSQYEGSVCDLDEDHDGCHTDSYSGAAWVDGARGKPQIKAALWKKTYRLRTFTRPSLMECIGYVEAPVFHMVEKAVDVVDRLHR